MKSLTKGFPLKLIVLFAVPLLFGYLFQLFYSVMDTYIVGVTLGESALAAVGSTSTVSDLMIHLINGMTSGFAILVANCFGEKNEKNMKKAITATFCLGIVFALIFSVGCVLFLNPILRALNVPENIWADAASYIRIILAGLLASALYNCCAAVLRAMGDSVSPLIFLIVSSVLNIVLDLYFILGLHMGVSGAALATVIAQTVSFLLCLLYMWIRYPVLRFEREDFGWDHKMLAHMLKMGASMGFMQAFVSFGTLALQTSINTFGTKIIIAHTAARKITMIYMLPFSVFGQTMATYCGQNFGAKEYKRIRDGLVQTTLLVWGWCLLVLVSAQIFAPDLIALITSSQDGEILRNGGNYLRFDTWFYFIPTMICLIRNGMQGFGDALTPVISSGVELVGKVLIAMFLAPAVGYWGIIVAEPIVWFFMVIPLIVQLLRNPLIRNTVKEA